MPTEKGKLCPTNCSKDTQTPTEKVVTTDTSGSSFNSELSYELQQLGLGQKDSKWSLVFLSIQRTNFQMRLSRQT